MGNENEVVYLYLDDIIPNRFQPREVFEDEALKELAISIREHGVIQPIIVRKIGSKYEIIAGERRYKASTLAGLTKIPAIIKNMDDKESSKVALIENLQRRDLTPIEEARTYQKILDLDDLTQEELAKTMGKSQSAVSNKLRLLTLPEEVQDALLHEEISERHARSLLNLNDPQKQVELLGKVISSRMTVRELDKEIKMLNPTGAVPVIPTPQVNIPAVEDIVEKKEENVEFLGGINTLLKPISPAQNKTTNTNNSNISPLSTNTQPSPLGISNIEKPINNLTEEPLGSIISEPKLTSIPNEVIEILDIDSNSSTPKIIPIKPTLETATQEIKTLAQKLTNQGYKIDIKEDSNNEYYQIILKINKQ